MKILSADRDILNANMELKNKLDSENGVSFDEIKQFVSNFTNKLEILIQENLNGKKESTMVLLKEIENIQCYFSEQSIFLDQQFVNYKNAQTNSEISVGAHMLKLFSDLAAFKTAINHHIEEQGKMFNDVFVFEAKKDDLILTFLNSMVNFFI
jgi:hypothetical protein